MNSKKISLRKFFYFLKDNLDSRFGWLDGKGRKSVIAHPSLGGKKTICSIPAQNMGQMLNYDRIGTSLSKFHLPKNLMKLKGSELENTISAWKKQYLVDNIKLEEITDLPDQR